MVSRRHIAALAAVTVGGVIALSLGYHVLGATVLDCSSQKEDCSDRRLFRTVERCQEWYPGSGYTPFLDEPCSRTFNGVDAVSLVTDRANHITSTFTQADYSVDRITPGLSGSWDLEFLPDGSLLVTEKDGRVVRYRDGELETVGTISTYNHSLVGLMGLAVDPAFERNRFIYLYYTDRKIGRESPTFPNKLDPGKYYVRNRVSRFQLVNGRLRNETVIVKNLPGSTLHAGGRLEIGPDGKLYVTTGDASNGGAASFRQYLNGKVLRFNLDGSIPASNPFNGSPVYTMGHRNPQGLAWHPDTGQAYSTEHGPWRYDEINRLKPSGNYGWSLLKCNVPSSDFAANILECTDPENTTTSTEQCRESLDNLEQVNTKIDRINLTPATVQRIEAESRRPSVCIRNWTLAPSGAAFVDDPGHPWHGDLFVAGLRGKHLRRFTADNGEFGTGEIFYVNRESLPASSVDRRFRDVEFWNGSLWVLGDYSGIARLQP
ncbi:MAG: sorbosone dehydrogenase family protein [Candidatus Nanohaloarchaea archaeon]